VPTTAAAAAAVEQKHERRTTHGYKAREWPTIMTGMQDERMHGGGSSSRGLAITASRSTTRQ